MGLRSTLSKKLIRDLWRLRAQALAIALIIAAGVGMVVMSFGMIRSLEATRTAYYELYRFAHLFAPLRRAPESLVAEVRAIPGVALAETRISAGAVLDVPGVIEPVSARVHSLPAGGQPALNQLVVRSGRLPDPRRSDEVVVNEAFATAARLRPGDRIGTVLYGHRLELRLVGTVLSPEYVYTVAPGQIFPDNRRFGIMWMGREPLAAALDLNQAFNDVSLRFAPGARQDDVIRQLDRLLAPYGGTGAYARDQQISDRFVTNEIGQLRVMVELLPPIFLGIAGFLLNIVLARLVDTEREVIGLLKAFGYHTRSIILHYAGLAFLLSAGGLAIGLAMGTWLGRELSGLYQAYFVFPFLEFRAGIDVYLIAALVTLLAVIAGAFAAVRRAAALTPAEAMRPPVPPDFSSRLSRLAAKLGPDEPSRMILRGLVRRPLRSALAVAGISAALALYIASASATDNVERMIDLIFNRSQRGDLIVAFAEARDARAIHELSRFPGVLRVEPFRAAGARLRFGHRVEREGLSSADPSADLNRIVDVEGNVIDPPPGGAILSSSLARQLQVGPADWITAELTEGDRSTLSIPVVRVIDAPVGASATVDRTALNRLLREGEVVSGAYLSVDDRELPRLYRMLKETPAIANVTISSAMLRSLRETIGENMGLVTLFNTGFAALIVLGVVYNSARISLSERARDLASLRVLGFRRGEVSFVLLGELALLVLLALPLGIPLGIGLSWLLTQAYSASADSHASLYTIPFGMNPATIAEGVLVVAAAAIATALLIRLRTDRIDLVQALKTRE